jgi:hypothetical protein
VTIPGTYPKDSDDRLRRNRDTIATTVLTEWDGVTRGPDLPDGYTWFKETKEWWMEWRQSPQASVMTKLDWSELLMAAILYNEVWKRGKGISPQAKVQCLGQVRRVTASFGATFEDRLKLRMNVKTDASDKQDEDALEADAYQAVDYAERLVKKAAELQAEMKAEMSQED